MDEKDDRGIRKRPHASDVENEDDEEDDKLLMDEDENIQTSDEVGLDIEKLILSDEENDDEENADKGKKEERGLELRNYQIELASLAVGGQNTIIHAATGAGKTRVAFYILKKHLDRQPDGKVAVLADKNFLVRQHYMALKAFLPEFEEKSVYLSGDKGNSADLHHLIEDKSVFILTPALIENTIKSKGDPSFIGKFTLMFFDECHHTHKKTTYKRLMNEYLKLKEQGRKLPQIVGLTATLGTNRANTLEKAKDHVLTIMANLDVAKISTVKENVDEYNHYRSDYTETKATLPEPDVKDPIYQCIEGAMVETERFILTVLELLDPRDAEERNLKDSLQNRPPERRYKPEYVTWISDVSSKATALLEKRRNEAHVVKMGTTYLKVYHEILYIYCYLVYDYAMSALEKRLEKDRLGPYSVSNDLKEEKFAQIAKDLITRMKSEAKTVGKQSQRRPIEMLLDQLEKQNDERRFILFVKTREFADMLNEFLNGKGYKCAAFTGASASTDEGGTSRSDQDRFVMEFKDGIIEGLIATNILEEGLDIPDCKCSLSYDYIGNEISTRQSTGRIRRKTGHRIVLASSKDTKRDAVNIQRGRLMDEAVKEVLEMNDEDVRAIIKRKQWQTCQSESRCKGAVSKVPKLDNSRFKMTCRSCAKFEVDCSKIKSINDSHHVLIDTDIWRKLTVKPYSKTPKPFDRDIILQGKLFGNGGDGCTHQWGTVFVYKDVKLPALSHHLLAVKDTENKRTWKLGKWAEAPFDILPIDDVDLNLMAAVQEK